MSAIMFRTVVKIFLFVFLFFLYSVLQTSPEAKEIQKVAIEIMNRAEKEALQRTIEQPFIEKKVARTTYTFYHCLR
jgi:hypothetical protein